MLEQTSSSEDCALLKCCQRSLFIKLGCGAFRVVRLNTVFDANLHLLGPSTGRPCSADWRDVALVSDLCQNAPVGLEPPGLLASIQQTSSHSIKALLAIIITKVNPCLSLVITTDNKLSLSLCV